MIIVRLFPHRSAGLPARE